jgi:hypothetical protein
VYICIYIYIHTYKFESQKKIQHKGRHMTTSLSSHTGKPEAGGSPVRDQPDSKKKKKKKKKRQRRLERWLRSSLSAFPEDQDSNPSTHMAAHNHLHFQPHGI